MKHEYLDYINSNEVSSFSTRISFNQVFAYDYNEVQELLFEKGKINYVFLIGKSNLKKTEMLGQIYVELSKSGINESNILYINMELPFFRDFDFLSYCKEWTKSNENHRLYLIINEIQMIDSWENFILCLREECQNIQLICSSTTATIMYERLFELHKDNNRIIVLSEKNDSNIKNITEGFGVYNNELKYNIKNGYVEIKGMTKEGKRKPEHIIPSNIEGLPVKIISGGAFHDRPELKSIVLPDTIEMIGDYAFCNCINLQNICLPRKTKYLGDNAFLGCVSLEIIEGGDNICYIGNSALYKTKWEKKQSKKDFIVLGKTLYRYVGSSSSIIVPSFIKNIGFYAFRDTKIKELVLTGQKIQEGAFYNCKKLEKVKNMHIRKIPAFAFFGCELLSNIDIEIGRVGKFAFYNCVSLKRIEGNNIIVNQAGFSGCKSLEEIGNIKEASTASFANTNLNTISNDINKIGKFAYYKSNLKTIDINTPAIIDDYAFAETPLEKFSINPNTKVGRKILFGCGEIKEMSISGCYKVRSYFGDFPNNLEKLIVYGNVCNNFNRDNNYLKSLTLIDVDKFGMWSFYNNNNLNIVVLENVRHIGEWAFAYCKNLKSIELPRSTKRININAFRYCNNLSKIVLRANEVVSLENNALYSTGEKLRIFIPRSLMNDYDSNIIWRNFSNRFLEI